MKRFLAIIFLLALLTGCGAKTTPDAEPDDAQEAESIREETAQAPGAGLIMELEHGIYDPSMEFLTYFVRNGTEETVDLGEDYGFQRQVNGQWQDLPFAENTGFDDIGYTLSPSGTMALTCWLGMLQNTPTAGTYRLVKTVGGQTLYAEFELGNSPYTADTPYGFASLETLPEDYSAASASEDTVVFTEEGTRNEDLVETFLYKVALGAACQLRTVQDYNESYPMVIDVIYESDNFLWRMWSRGSVTEQRFSYLVTDGQELYLSNGADWDSGEQYGDKRTLLMPEGTAFTDMVTRVEEMTADRLAGNNTRYKVWSADGQWNVRLTETSSEFVVSSSGRGEVFDLQDWDGMETSVLDISWQSDGTLRLKCGTAQGGTSYLIFDPDTQAMHSR